MMIETFYVFASSHNFAQAERWILSRCVYAMVPFFSTAAVFREWQGMENIRMDFVHSIQNFLP